MYHMKSIVSFNDEIILPKCMYSLKKITEPVIADEMDINVRNQVITFLKQAPTTKMTELEERQDVLLKKLDILYDRIKTISSYCKFGDKSTYIMESEKDDNVVSHMDMEEIVMVLTPDNLPWFLNIYLKHLKDFYVSWHIHSSVPNDKKQKILAFFKKFAHLYLGVNKKINLRIIFKCAEAELKIFSLDIPIVGIVNVMRYMALAHPTIAFYDFNNYQVDSLLDLCCLLERAPEKNKEALVNKIFSQQKDWIYGNNFSIVDLAVYNIVKQWQNSTKYIPKNWFVRCETMVM